VAHRQQPEWSGMPTSAFPGMLFTVLLSGTIDRLGGAGAMPVW
jgi:hypothetical protein